MQRKKLTETKLSRFAEILNGDNGYQNKLVYPPPPAPSFPAAKLNNELKNREWKSTGKIETDIAPVFAFNNVPSAQRCTGSQLEYVSILILPFIQETKIYIIFRLGVQIIFQVSHTQLPVWCRKIS